MLAIADRVERVADQARSRTGARTSPVNAAARVEAAVRRLLTTPEERERQAARLAVAAPARRPVEYVFDEHGRVTAWRHATGEET